MENATNYLMVLPVRHKRIDDSHVAVESAFAEHLRMMHTRIPAPANTLVVASPGMSAPAYEAGAKGWAHIDENREPIRFVTLFSDDEVAGPANKIKRLSRVVQDLWSLAKQSTCVHSGLSWDLWLPFEFLSIIAGVVHKKSTVFVVDIDYRKSAYMSYRTGVWSRKSYLICKYVYDSARTLQVSFASRFCSLVLLKGKQMAVDFGEHRPAVRDFLDASHSQGNIINDASLTQKLATLRDASTPLKLVYFGRLVAYKGIDHCLRAVARAREAGSNITLDVIGGGEQDAELRALATKLNTNGYVTFHGARPFNQDFFQLLYPFHLLLAAPLREDTPRSALDAMAAGIPFLAFDTYYYRQLMESGAGRVVPWLDDDAMARALTALALGREQVAGMVECAVAFATGNTQEIWLERRLRWTSSAMSRT